MRVFARACSKTFAYFVQMLNVPRLCLVSGINDSCVWLTCALAQRYRLQECCKPHTTKTHAAPQSIRVLIWLIRIRRAYGRMPPRWTIDMTMYSAFFIACNQQTYRAGSSYSSTAIQYSSNCRLRSMMFRAQNLDVCTSNESQTDTTRHQDGR